MHVSGMTTTFTPYKIWEPAPDQTFREYPMWRWRRGWEEMAANNAAFLSCNRF